MEEADRGNQNQANVDLAREAFNDYLIQYPGHSRNAEARKLIASLGGRDLQRSFDIAEFYLKTGKTESAKVYYRDIVKRTRVRHPARRRQSPPQGTRRMSPPPSPNHENSRPARSRPVGWFPAPAISSAASSPPPWRR